MFDDLGHGFDLPGLFIASDEWLKQVAEVGLEILLLDDRREIDKIPELRFSIGQLVSISVGSKRWVTSWGCSAPLPSSPRMAPRRWEEHQEC